MMLTLWCHGKLQTDTQIWLSKIFWFEQPSNISINIYIKRLIEKETTKKHYLACIFVCYFVDCVVFFWGGLIFVKAALSLDPSYTQWKGNDECNCMPEIVCLNDTYPAMWICHMIEALFFLITKSMFSSLIGIFFFSSATCHSIDWISILSILERSLWSLRNEWIAYFFE